MKTFAIIYTVKNEWGFLKYIIPYYLKQGASKIYVFLDNCTDDTRSKLNSIKNVEVYKSLEGYSNLREKPSYLEENYKGFGNKDTIDYRKKINTFVALNKAKESNIDWLAVIDPDELIVKNENSPNIQTLLNSIPENIDQILMENYELFPISSICENPFKKQIYFIKRIRYLDRLINKVLIFLKIISPKKKFFSKLEYLIFKYLLNYSFLKVAINPINRKKIYRGIFLGYKGVKPFIRTKNAQYYNFNIHKWIPYIKKPKNIYSGIILHYNLINSEHFLAKFRKRSEVEIMSLKSLSYSQYQLSQVANLLNKEEAESFFKKYFIFQEKYKDSRFIVNFENVSKELSQIDPID